MSVVRDGGCLVCDECDGDEGHDGAHDCGHTHAPCSVCGELLRDTWLVVVTGSRDGVGRAVSICWRVACLSATARLLRSKPPTGPIVKLQKPPGGRITNDFLRSFRDAYYDAHRAGIPTGPTLAAEAGVSPFTIHRWTAIARDRGIMPKGEAGVAG